MIEFSGTFFDGKTSKKQQTSVVFDGQNIVLEIEGADEDILWPLTRCKFTPSLGKTDRAVLFPDGTKCVTTNHTAIHELEKRNGNNSVFRLIHTLEQRWRLAIGCMVGLIISVYLFTAYGIPVIAKAISHNVPVAIMNSISDDVLVLLDHQLFEPTELDSEKQTSLNKLLAGHVREIKSGHEYRLQFRSSKKAGPNAFALPSGTIIVTDQLIDIIEEEKEISAILLHEIGHVEHRHGLRSVLQNTGVFFLISALAGDLVSISSVAGSFPTLLVESGYSRKFEKEADTFSVEYFIERDWSIKPFQNILKRITHDMGPGVDMISTHPGTKERIKFLQSLDKTQH